MTRNNKKWNEVPYSMQLEVTWGCNRRCWFCGIHDIPLKELHFMDLDIAQGVAEECNSWKPNMRMEFGTGGEPTLHPDFMELVNTLRVNCPKMQIMVQTNVEPWSNTQVEAQDWIRNWFQAGGNILVLNCYKTGIKAKIASYMEGMGLDVIDFYDGNPEHRSMYHNKGPKTQEVFLCEDLGLMTLENKTAKVSQRWLNNQGGSTPEKGLAMAGMVQITQPLHKRCVQPFRQLVLSWDGTAPLCCYDWLDRLVVGKFPEQSLEEIWNGRPMNLARKLLHSGNRNFMPCLTCDFHGGFRVGMIDAPSLKITEKQAEEELRALVEDQAKNWKEYQVKGVNRLRSIITREAANHGS